MRCYWLVLLGLLGLKTVQSIYETYFRTSSSIFADYVIKDFGLTRGGYIKVDYNVSHYSMTSNSSYILLLVLDDNEKSGWYSDLDDDSKYCQLPSFARLQASNQGTFDIFIPDSASDARYSLLVLQCRLPEIPVSVSISASMTNPRPYSSEVSHLPIEDVMVTRVLTGELILYFMMLGALVLQFIVAKEWLKPIHYGFLASLFFQIVALFAEFYAYYFYNQHGYEPLVQQYAISIANHFSNVAVLGTVFLLSLGWSLVRHRLYDKEYRLLLGIMGTYFVFGLSSACCLDLKQTQCQSLFVLTYVIRTFIFIGIIIALNFTVTQLKATLSHSPWTQTIAIQYMRARQYQFFRIAFIIYLLVPTAILLVQSSIFTWEEDWIPFTLNELLIIMVFFHIGITFSPMNEGLLLRAFDGTLNSIAVE